MPIYEYQCKKCDTTFETLVFSSSTEEVACDCGSTEVRKLISAAGIKVSKEASMPSPSNCQARGGFS